MKMRNKGKVYPSSTSSTSTPVASTAGDSLSVLNLLPAAILGLAVVLSLEDQEVLAYMITRSINSTNPSSSSSSSSVNKKKKKTSNTHKPPLFECDCFDCYTSYWFKWDSSPNRELIHQAIEAFEDTFTNSQLSDKNKNKKTKKKERMLSHHHLPPNSSTPPPPPPPEIQESPEYELEERAEENPDGVLVLKPAGDVEAEPPETAVVARSAAASQQKGLPDVIRLLKWRLWSIWSPNV